MKQAIGSGWMLGFVSIFIVLFTAYLAISVNYTKAFKVKNRIISLIEENEGFTYSSDVKETGTNIDDIKNKAKQETEDKIYLYLNEIGYNYTDVKCPDSIGDGNEFTGGYCVKKITNSQGSDYTVATFISLELPIIWIKINVPITGETKVIYNVHDDL